MQRYRSWQRVGLNIAIISICATPISCGQNETSQYTEQLNTPEQVSNIVKQLEYSNNTRALFYELGCLPEETQVSATVLQYLTDIAGDRAVTSEELINFRDLDNDGLGNNDELRCKTDLLRPDTDNDGIKDTEEVFTYLTDPIKPNPNVRYAIDRGVFDYIEQIKSMDDDGLQSESEKNIINTMNQILETRISDLAKRRSIFYLLDYPLEFIPVYNSLKSDGILNEYLEIGIDGNIIKYLSLIENKANADYFRNTRLGIQDGYITEFDNRILNEPEQNAEKFYNYFLYEIGLLNPELAAELERLPDFQSIELRDAEAIEDIFYLVVDPDSGEAFEAMLNEGIKDKRTYCTPLEALTWIAFDREFGTDYNPLEETESEEQSYSLDFLLAEAWQNTTESDSYTSDRWYGFNEVIDRLNSPGLIKAYTRDNFIFDYRGGSIPYNARTMLYKKMGDCKDFTMFSLYALLSNGYSYDDFETQDNTAVSLHVIESDGLGHAVCLYKQDNVFYTLDNKSETILGPFPTIEAAAESAKENWTRYLFMDINKKYTFLVER